MQTHTTQTKTGGNVPLPRVGGALPARSPQYRGTAASMSNAARVKSMAEGEAAFWFTRVGTQKTIDANRDGNRPWLPILSRVSTRAALPPGGDLRQNRTYAIFDAQSCGVDHNPFDVPRTVIPLDHFLPRRQSVARDVRRACLHAPSMLARI